MTEAQKPTVIMLSSRTTVVGRSRHSRADKLHAGAIIGHHGGLG